jgi:hypothetical protein
LNTCGLTGGALLNTCGNANHALPLEDDSGFLGQSLDCPFPFHSVWIYISVPRFSILATVMRVCPSSFAAGSLGHLSIHVFFHDTACH